MTQLLWLVSFILLQSTFAQNDIKIDQISNFHTKAQWKISNKDLKISKSSAQGPMVFSDIKLEGWSLTKTVGSPSVPFKSILLEGIPTDFNVEVNAVKVFNINDVAPVPAQQMPCRCDIIPWKFNVDFDEKSYNSKSREHIFVEYMGKFRGKDISRVRFSPVAYNHKSGMRFISEGSVEIKSNQKINVASMSAEDRRLVIFTADKFKSSLDRLVDYRTAEGYEVKVITLSEIGQSFEEVRAYIKDLYKKQSFSYSMIIGHEEIFPTEYVSTRFDENTPSDMNYYTLDGDTDGQRDVIPDILYSRISVDTIDELNRFIDKSLEFEARSWKDGLGKNMMIAIASDEGSAPSDVEYVRQMQNPLKKKFNWKSREFFQANSDSIPSNVQDRISDGSIWLNYIGHGSGYAWPSLFGEDFSTAHINSLRANGVKPIIIDVACQNGRFSNEARMGESFIRATDGRSPAGAVAYYGGSVDISWDPPAVMAIGAGVALSENNNRRLIDVLWAGQRYLLENYDDRQGALENFVWYHLQGDPLLNLNNLQ
ncbi:C25 family cysteine peptidase [Halobacteriovorax sp. HLS]|uniref:C25 family cysteine peptidase n=1 Tax=Halobacteriovorax sp. HLS TaxID=2234000 RepID=UPI000FDC13D0|nr:C25 family cysteine peptidase [Halobacteriovorax sp. HLS]